MVLDLERLDPLLPDAATLWVSDYRNLRSEDTRLEKPRVVAIRISLPSDKSFETYEEALAHLSGPKLNNDMKLVWDRVMMDVQARIHDPQ